MVNSLLQGLLPPGPVKSQLRVTGTGMGLGGEIDSMNMLYIVEPGLIVK